MKNFIDCLKILFFCLLIAILISGGFTAMLVLFQPLLILLCWIIIIAFIITLSRAPYIYSLKSKKRASLVYAVFALAILIAMFIEPKISILLLSPLGALALLWLKDYHKDELISNIIYGEISSISSLINQKKNLEYTDKNGRTPLFYAVAYDRKEIVKLLISKGEKINIKDKKGNTPIYYAKNEGMKELLMSNGAQEVNINRYSYLLRIFAYGLIIINIFSSFYYYRTIPSIIVLAFLPCRFSKILLFLVNFMATYFLALLFDPPHSTFLYKISVIAICFIVNIKSSKVFYK